VEPIPPGMSVSLMHNGKEVSNPKSAHQFENYLQLVGELREQTPAKVTLVEDFLEAAQPTGVVVLYPRYGGILFEQVMDRRESRLPVSIPRQLALLNAVYRDVDSLLGQYDLAALVDRRDYRYWWNIGQGTYIRQAMYGLTTVAEEIGASIKFELEQGPYCYMLGEESERLPSLLLRYLEAYVRIVPGVLG
jgi:signal recognition particle subunit SEC65